MAPKIPTRDEIQRAYAMLKMYGWRELMQFEKEIIMFDIETSSFTDAEVSK